MKEGGEGGREGRRVREGGREGGKELLMRTHFAYARGREPISNMPDGSLCPISHMPDGSPVCRRGRLSFCTIRHCLGQNARRLADKMALRAILKNAHAADTSAGPASTVSQPEPRPALQDGRERFERAGHRDEDEAAAALPQRMRRLLQVRANAQELPMGAWGAHGQVWRCF
jgi:hypothetical protein